MPEYLQLYGNGRLSLTASALRKEKLREGDLLEVVVEVDGTIRLLPKLATDRVLVEKYQLDDIDWAVKQKGKPD